jgi:hypothetical protein
MKISERKTLAVTCSSDQELEELSQLMAPHSWASGEFGILLTDAAFQAVAVNITHMQGHAPELARQVGALNDLLKSGDYSDICLDSFLGDD